MKNINLYTDEKYKYILELWGASTRHPDSIFHFSDFKAVDFIDEKYQVFQWLLECASKMTLPQHAKEIADYAYKHWVNF